MGEALILKTGGGIDSSDVTATTSDVLSSTTALTSDSADEAVYGTMRNCHISDYTTTLTSTDSKHIIPCSTQGTYINADNVKRVSLNIPKTGYYTDGDNIAVAPSTLVSETGAGYWGTSSTTDVLSGKTFTTANGFSLTGTMINRIASGTTNLSSTDSRKVVKQTGATVSTCTDGVERAIIATDEGYYDNNSSVGVPVITMAGAVGLNASKILTGTTYLGVTGTMPDYASGRVVFNYGTFDGTLVSGVQDISDPNDATAYTELVAGVGVHMYSNYVPYKSDPYGLAIVVFKNYSINLTPFSKIRIKLDGTTSNPEDNGTKTSIWLLGSNKITKVKTLLSYYKTYGTFTTDKTFDISDVNQQCFLCVQTSVFRDTGNESLPHQDSYVRYVELIN